MRWTKLLLWGLAGTTAARAEVSFGPLFADRAVLQQGVPLPIWGTAAPGERVSVRFAGQRVSAEAGPDGRWIVVLTPLGATENAEDLTATGRTTATARDVVVGEVWLASGQSNMEFTVDSPDSDIFRVDNAEAEVAAAHFPMIREFTVGRQAAAAPIATAAGAWTACTPESVRQFSAVAYFFARSLHKRLGVPIGIVNSTWGGTPVESWMSPMAMASEAGFSVVGERWRRAMRAYPKAKADWDEKTAVWTQGRDAALRKGPTAFAVYLHEHPRPGEPPGPDSKSTPMSLFNGMINPLLPFGLRGVIWYQGEANVGRSSEYQALFSAMITAWRAHIGEGDLPFYWVQLPNYADPYDASQMGWALLREAQHRTLGLPNTGEVVAIDVGDPKNLHPRNKQEVGRRLALVAKAQVYGIADDWSGPVFDHAVRDGRALRVFFRFADTGLTAGARPLQSFEIAGADGVFHPASAAISGDTVVVSSPLVADPAKVRYAWRDAPDANLFNGAGLPAAPFRSDEPGY